MGPPELPGGNQRLGRAAPPSARGFNGAAGITRRKPPALVMVAKRQPLLQWGRRNYPAETRAAGSMAFGSSLCFNGAAGITRRKRAALYTGQAPRYTASMGPPELPGGNMEQKQR